MPVPIADDFPFINQRMRELNLSEPAGVQVAARWAVWFEPLSKWVVIRSGEITRVAGGGVLPSLFNTHADAENAIASAVDRHGLRAGAIIKQYPDAPA